jgi:primosomal protein N''
METEQIIRLQRLAKERIHYINWIAEKLLSTDDILIRKEAAKLLRELVS